MTNTSTTATVRALATATLLALAACGDVGEIDDEGGLVDAAEPAPAPVADAAPVPAPVVPPAAGAGPVARCLTLEFDPACVGQWADASDATSRWTAHPETGLGTFACRWQDNRCGEPWYRDERCTDEHAARLEATCERVGGTCTSASDGERYCTAE